MLEKQPVEVFGTSRKSLIIDELDEV